MWQAMDARQRKEQICRMVMENRTSTRKRPNRKLRYFYLGDKPHKVIHIIRAADLVVAWSYDDRKRVGYVWSDLKKKMEPALKTNQVAKIINRDRTKVLIYVERGMIPSPKKAYTMDGRFLPSIYLWSPKDVYNLHDFLLTQHRGRPRKDGLVTPWRLPTRAEVRAMLEDDNAVFYVKTSDGEFSPVWKEHNW